MIWGVSLFDYAVPSSGGACLYSTRALLTNREEDIGTVAFDRKCERPVFTVNSALEVCKIADFLAVDRANNIILTQAGPEGFGSGFNA